MSAYVVIACDVKDRPEHGGTCMSEDAPIGLPRTVTETRRRLARQGWRRTRDGSDICLDCWTAGRR